MEQNESNIIIYNTIDGKASVVLYARDGSVWMNQNQLAELFDTSKQGIGQHIANILNERELVVNSVVKKFFTTAADGKNYEVQTDMNSSNNADSRCSTTRSIVRSSLPSSSRITRSRQSRRAMLTHPSGSVSSNGLYL